MEVNSNIHKEAGRTHKHEITKETDSRNNLPFAVKREEYESLSVLDGWKKLCDEANIIHEGRLILPDN